MNIPSQSNINKVIKAPPATLPQYKPQLLQPYPVPHRCQCLQPTFQCSIKRHLCAAYKLKYIFVALPAERRNPRGQIAQSVEQGIENPCVGGSIPPLATNVFCAQRKITPESVLCTAQNHKSHPPPAPTHQKQAPDSGSTPLTGAVYLGLPMSQTRAHEIYLICLYWLPARTLQCLPNTLF